MAQRRSAVPSRRQTASRLIRVGARAGQYGYRIRPEARTLIVRYVAEAARKRTLKTEEDVNKAVAGLTAAAVAEARDRNSKTVTPHDVRQGWQGRLCLGPGNCPPHECMRRSIVARSGRLSSSLKFYGMFVDTLGD